MNFPEFLQRKFLEWQLREGGRKRVEDFASFIGVRQSLVSMWMNGTRSPSKENTKRLVQLFGDAVLTSLDIDPNLYYTTAYWDHLDPQLKRAISDLLSQIETARTDQEQKKTLELQRRETLRQITELKRHASLHEWLSQTSPVEINRTLHLLLEKIVVSSEAITLHFRT